MKLFLFLAVSICTLPVSLFAQEGWKVADIPDSLRREAHSVIRTYELTVNAPSDKLLSTRCRMVVTVLNKKGDGHASWHCYTSKFESLSSFSGKVYDEQGKVIRKLKRGDVHASQYSEHLATDNQLNYLEPPVADYPYTVEYEWEMKASDGYMEYGMLSPVGYNRQALQNAEFRLTVPSGTGIRYKVMPCGDEAQKKTSGKTDEYYWRFPAMRGVIDEDYEDNSLYVLPSVIAMPQTFKLGASSGSLDSWESFGHWYAMLAEERDKLLPADAEKVRELVADCKTDREKIETLYGYLADKTRYVSIQLGIGGWQPMSAVEVGKTGFGDCKALTNYMQALLREVGIVSYQTIISTEYSDLIPGFPNMHQMDHVILTVPQSDGGNLVIECTNPQLPLGFIPGGYAGHEALQICKGEGRLVRIDDYSPTTNYEEIKADVWLNADGKSKVTYSCSHYGDRYGRVRSMAQESEYELKNIVVKWINCKNTVVTDVAANESLVPVPHLDVKSTMDVNYGEVHGDRIFLSSNPFRSMSFPRLRKGRQRPVFLHRSYSFNDEVVVHLPEGYIYKSEEINESQTADFGSYSFTVRRKDEGTLVVKSSICIRKGRIDVPSHAEFTKFADNVSNIHKRLLIIESGK